MESLQALAIAAAALVTGLSLDRVSLPDRLTAEVQAMAERAFVAAAAPQLERPAYEFEAFEREGFEPEQVPVVRCATAKGGWL